MIAMLDDESMRKVVQGPDNRSRGLVSCRIQKTDQVDHNRYFNLPRGIPGDEQAYEFMVWDFVLTRDDESEVSLHPSLSENKLDCINGVRGTDREVPKTGLDGSSGPSTFKHSLKIDAKPLSNPGNDSCVYPHSGVSGLPLAFVPLHPSALTRLHPAAHDSSVSSPCTLE